MARAVITTDFASPAETAQALGVSRASREKLVRMAELAIHEPAATEARPRAMAHPEGRAQASLDRNRFFSTFLTALASVLFF